MKTWDVLNAGSKQGVEKTEREEGNNGNLAEKGVSGIDEYKSRAFVI